MMFALVAASHVIIICFFGWLAVGGDIAGFWRLIAPHWASITRECLEPPAGDCDRKKVK
jgi:hypothetical protein